MNPDFFGQPYLGFSRSPYEPWPISPTVMYPPRPFSSQFTSFYRAPYKPIPKDVACQTMFDDHTNLEDGKSISNQHLSPQLSLLSDSEFYPSDKENDRTTKLRDWAPVGIHPDGSCCIAGFPQSQPKLIHSKPIVSVCNKGHVLFDGTDYFHITGKMCWNIYQLFYPQMKSVKLSNDIRNAFLSGFPPKHWRSWTQGLYFFTNRNCQPSPERRDANSDVSVTYLSSELSPELNEFIDDVEKRRLNRRANGTEVSVTYSSSGSLPELNEFIHEVDKRWLERRAKGTEISNIQHPYISSNRNEESASRERSPIRHRSRKPRPTVNSEQLLRTSSNYTARPKTSRKRILNPSDRQDEEINSDTDEENILSVSMINSPPSLKISPIARGRRTSRTTANGRQQPFIFPNYNGRSSKREKLIEVSSNRQDARINRDANVGQHTFATPHYEGRSKKSSRSVLAPSSVPRTRQVEINYSDPSSEHTRRTSSQSIGRQLRKSRESIPNPSDHQDGEINSNTDEENIPSVSMINSPPSREISPIRRAGGTGKLTANCRQRPLISPNFDGRSREREERIPVPIMSLNHQHENIRVRKLSKRSSNVSPSDSTRKSDKSGTKLYKKRSSRRFRPLRSLSVRGVSISNFKTDKKLLSQKSNFFENRKLYLRNGGVVDVKDLKRTRFGRLSVPVRDLCHRQDLVFSSTGVQVNHGDLEKTFSSFIDD